MKWLHAIRWWLYDVIRKRRMEQDMDEEIRAHILMRTRDNVRDGMTPEDSALAARRRFGNVGYIKELCRDVAGGRVAEIVIRDARFACRTLRKNRGFTAVAVLSLALGIGATTAIFTVADPLLFKKLPVQNPDELVSLGILNTSDPGSPDQSVPYLYFERLNAGTDSFAGVFLAAAVDTEFPVTFEGEAASGGSRQFSVAMVSGDYFAVLGVDATIGRTFTKTDDQPAADPVVVISHRLWRSRFGADPQVLGKVITFDNASFTIVGVGPSSFYGINVDDNPDIWVPFHVLVERGRTSRAWRFSIRFVPDEPIARVMGRLKSGVTLQQAQAEVDSIHRQISEASAGPYDDDEVERFARVQSAATGYSSLRFEYVDPVFILTAAAAAVLLIACANVAALLLARGAARSKEAAVRLAIGSSRFAIARHLLIEGTILAILSGALGIGMAYWGADLLLSYLPPESGFVEKVSIDIRVLSFVSAVSLFSVLAFCLVPALQTSRLDVHATLKSDAHRFDVAGSRTPLNRMIVTAQVAFSLVLLVVAGLFLRTLHNLRSVDSGFDQENVVQFRVQQEDRSVNWDPASLLTQVEALPQVQSATYYWQFVLTRSGRRTIQVEGNSLVSGEISDVQNVSVGSSQFLKTMGISLRAGRDFRPEDWALNEESSVGLISQNLARYLFGEQSPIGRTIREDDSTLEIVGVVEDARVDSLRTQPWTMYRPDPNMVDTFRYFAVRTSGGTDIAPAIQTIVQRMNPALRATDIQTLREVAEGTMLRERLIAQLAGLFGLIALFLASLGVYGLLSYSTAQRRREIGIRLAVGAQVRQVTGMLLGESLLIVGAGIVVGLLAAFAVTRVFSTLLFGLTPLDPLTMAAASFVLILVALAAGYLPARKASRADPLSALRHE